MLQLLPGGFLRNVASVSSGKVRFQPATADSTDFFQVLDLNGGTPVFNVDTENELVGVRCVPNGAILDTGGWVGKPANMEVIGLNVKGDFFAGNSGTGQGRYRVGSNFAAGFLYWNSYYESVAAELRAMDSGKPAFRARFDGQNDRIQFSRAAATAGAQSFVDQFTIDSSSGNITLDTGTVTAKLDLNLNVIRLRNDKTPASAGASGSKGDISWDSSYIYVCVATDTWERAGLSSW